MSDDPHPTLSLSIFVSSTYDDLKDQRAAVEQALHRLEALVRGMEYFGSRPGRPKDECLAEVRKCRAFIGIFGTRYGSIDPESGMSLTHLEYLEAQRLSIPTLVYLLDEERLRVRPDPERGFAVEGTAYLDLNGGATGCGPRGVAGAGFEPATRRGTARRMVAARWTAPAADTTTRRTLGSATSAALPWRQPVPHAKPRTRLARDSATDAASHSAVWRP